LRSCHDPEGPFSVGTQSSSSTLYKRASRQETKGAKWVLTESIAKGRGVKRRGGHQGRGGGRIIGQKPISHNRRESLPPLLGEGKEPPGQARWGGIGEWR